jgi:hypothetical protein
MLENLVYSHSIVRPCYCKIREGYINYKNTIYNPNNKHNVGANEDEIEFIHFIDDKGSCHILKHHYCNLCRNFSNSSILNK